MCVNLSPSNIYLPKSRCLRLSTSQVGCCLQSPPFLSLPSLKQSHSVVIRTNRRKGSSRISPWQSRAATTSWAPRLPSWPPAQMATDSLSVCSKVNTECFAPSLGMEPSKQPAIELLMQDVSSDIYFQGLQSTCHQRAQYCDRLLMMGPQLCQTHLALQSTHNTAFNQRPLSESHKCTGVAKQDMETICSSTTQPKGGPQAGLPSSIKHGTGLHLYDYLSPREKIEALDRPGVMFWGLQRASHAPLGRVQHT